jgi:hypothetical protein
LWLDCGWSTCRMTSAFFVVTANAWMQQPHGFDLVDGQGDNARTVRARSVGVSANANREWFQAKMNTRIAAVNTPRAASGSSPSKRLVGVAPPTAAACSRAQGLPERRPAST